MPRLRWIALLLFCLVFFASLASSAERRKHETREKLFVIAEGLEHKGQLKALAGAASFRMEFDSPGNAFTFSGEFTKAQREALSRQGARFAPVEEVHPVVRPERVGHLRSAARPAAAGRPYCGDGRCSGREDSASCPSDCGAGNGDPPARPCLPQDQEEYQTLFSNGEVPSRAGSGVRLFVIDTGTTVGHPDLDVSECRDVTGSKVRRGCDDENGHGTHTTGSAAANAGADGAGLVGAAPGATLGVIKICGTACFADALVRGIEEAVKKRADVISLSFVASDTEPLRNAVQYAVGKGVLFFAAAGNAGPQANSIAYPAAYPETIAVGMLGPDRMLSPISSRGLDDGDDGRIGERELELVGGGFVVESTWTDGCYKVLSGTSMATPAVAGFAAANWQGDAASTRAWLAAVADDQDGSERAPEIDPSTRGWDAASGYGLPRTSAGTDGGGAAAVSTSPNAADPGQEIAISVSGFADAPYRLGVSSPSGGWTWGEFVTDGAGDDEVRLTPWRDPGVWLVSIDFGGGRQSFDAAWASFRQF
ncbi:MAG: S8 family serine peptidase [Myxococcota bacterium]